MEDLMEDVSLDLESETEAIADREWEILDKNKGPPSPSSDDEYRSQNFASTRPTEYDHEDSDAEEDEEYSARMRGELASKKKKGGYDSRIEQILYENPELPILITDAGKSVESGGKYIVYTIRTGVSCPALTDVGMKLTKNRILRLGGGTQNSQA